MCFVGDGASSCLPVLLSSFPYFPSLPLLSTSPLSFLFSLSLLLSLPSSPFFPSLLPLPFSSTFSSFSLFPSHLPLSVPSVYPLSLSHLPDIPSLFTVKHAMNDAPHIVNYYVVHLVTRILIIGNSYVNL